MEEQENFASQEADDEIIVKQTEENYGAKEHEKSDRDKSEIIENISLDFRTRKQQIATIDELIEDWIINSHVESNEEKLLNAISQIEILNNKIKYEKCVWGSDIKAKDKQLENNMQEGCRLISLITPLMDLFKRVKKKLISLLQENTMNSLINQNQRDPANLDRYLDYIYKIIETGINIDAEDGILSISEFNLFMNAIWNMQLNSNQKEGVSQHFKDQLVQILDKVLKRNCITIDSGIQTILLMSKLNLEKKLSRQILDFVIDSLKECCEFANEPK